MEKEKKPELNLFNKDKIWIRIKNYIYFILFFIIILTTLTLITLILNCYNFNSIKELKFLYTST